VNREWKIALLVGAAAGVLYLAGALIAWSISLQVLAIYSAAVGILTPVAGVVLICRKGRR
jgi:hypothetical protein